MPLISFYLVLDPDYLLVSPAVKPAPERLNLHHPSLMCDVRKVVRILLLTIDWKQVLQGFHLTLRVHFLIHDKLDFWW